MLFHQSEAQTAERQSQRVLAVWTQTREPEGHGTLVPVRSQWGRSYVPSELFFLYGQNTNMMEEETFSTVLSS